MAKRDLRTLLVVDVEATCWEGDAPPGEQIEIIEVGVALLDLVTLEPTDRWSTFVRPERSKISPFCTKLTTITAEHVANAPSFVSVCARLRKDLATRERPWASWGSFDRRQFEKDCAATGATYPFGHEYLDLKTVFGVMFGLNQYAGLTTAMARLGLSFEGTHHRGEDDAWNTARVASAMFARSREAGRLPL